CDQPAKRSKAPSIVARTPAAGGVLLADAGTCHIAPWTPFRQAAVHAAASEWITGAVTVRPICTSANMSLLAIYRRAGNSKLLSGAGLWSSGMFIQGRPKLSVGRGLRRLSLRIGGLFDGLAGYFQAVLIHVKSLFPIESFDKFTGSLCHGSGKAGRIHGHR